MDRSGLESSSSSSSVEFWSTLDTDAVVIGSKDISDFNPENILPESDTVQASIRSWLSPTQYEGDGSEYKAHRAAHLAGTGNWVFDSDIYHQWYNGNDGILWIRGVPGAGKSVLASVLIRRLRQETVPVLYFFFRHTLDTNNHTEALLRDWLVQILEFSPPLQRELNAKRPKWNPLTRALSMDELWRYLRRALMFLPKVYCIIDALDEIDPKRLEPLVRSLDALGRWRPAEIKLIITSRPVTVVEKIFSGVKTLDVRLDKKRVEKDIARYIQHRLGSSSVPPQHWPAIEQAITKRVDGLFLFAKLALDDLLQSSRDKPTDFTRIPADLTKLYTKLLLEHCRKVQEVPAPATLQEFVLQLVTHATRPLRLLEIADLVKLIYTLPHDLGAVKDLIRSLCGPLVEILPDETLRIIHHSLTEYLTGMTNTSETDTRPFPIFGFEATHHRLAMSCLSYLASGCLDHVDIVKRRHVLDDVDYIEPAYLKESQVFPPFTRYAGSNWAIHVRRAKLLGQDQTQINEALDRLLIDPNLDKVEVLINTKMSLRPTPLHFAIGLELDDYARHLLSQKKPEYLKDGRLEPSLLLYAAEIGNEDVVELLLDHGADPLACNDRGRTSLHLAVSGDHAKVAAVLIDFGVDVCVARGHDNYFCNLGESEIPWTPLERAFARGSFEMTTVFSQRLQTPTIVTEALYRAISERNTRAVELLLQHPLLDINAYHQGKSPIFAACRNRDVRIMDMLLKSGAVVNQNPKSLESSMSSDSELRPVLAFEDTEVDTALHHKSFDAVRGYYNSSLLHTWTGAGVYNAHRQYRQYRKCDPSNEDLARGIRLLLAHGADVHQVNEMGELPIHLAWDAATLNSLLEGGADPNAVNSFGKTLLHICCTKEVLDVLLEKADLNIQTKYEKRTPLLDTLVVDGWTPTEEWRVMKALRLIESGADVNSVDKYGNSALHLAVGYLAGSRTYKKHTTKTAITLIEKLCFSGVDVNLKNFQGKTPLHMNAAGYGRVSVIGRDSACFNTEALDILIAAGADINARDNRGQTLLFQYVQDVERHSYGEALKNFDLMVQAGAKTNIVDEKGRSLLHAHVKDRGFDITFLEHMVEHGCDPLHVDDGGNTLLHEIAPGLAKILSQNRTYPVLEKLVEAGVDPRRPNNLGRNLLHTLASIHPGAFDSGDRPCNADDGCAINFCLRSYPDLADSADRYGIRPLHLASTFSEYLTRRLLEEGASPSKATCEGLTPFHIAARSRQANIIGILVDKIQSTLTQDEISDVLNKQDVQGRTALYYAAASGRVESFRLLIDAGATLDLESYTGSAWNGCANFEEELGNWSYQVSPKSLEWRKRAVKIDAGGILIHDTARPPCVEGWFPAERLDEILDILASSVSKDQASFVAEAMASAAEKNYDYTVECLFRARKILDSSAEQNIDEATQACLRRRAESRLASEGGDTDAIVRLMKLRDYKAVSLKLNRVDTNSKLVYRLISGGFAALVSSVADKVFLSEIDKQNQQGEAQSRVLRLLVQSCLREMPNMDMIRLLVEDKKVNIDARMRVPTYSNEYLSRAATALHHLADGNHWWQTAQAIPYLVHHGADVNAVAKTTGLTPLGYALRSIGGPHFNKRTVETLLALGANPNGLGRFEGSYLAWTVKYPEIFQMLVQHGAVITRAALAAAVSAQDLDLVQTMLSNGADPNQRKVGEERPEVQVSEYSFESARSDPETHEELYLIDWIAGGLQSCRNKSPKNPQIIDQIFQLLLDYGADPFAPYLKTTVLHRVMQNQRLHNSYVRGLNRYLHLLLDQPNLKIDTRDSDGRTLLLLAPRQTIGVDGESIVPIIEKLLDRGADIYSRDYKGRSIMHYASCHPKQSDLVYRKAPELLNSPDNQRETPLHYILDSKFDQSRVLPAAFALIDMGADVTNANTNGESPLHIVLRRFDWVIHEDDSIGGAGREMFDYLRLKGADVNACNNAGETPIFAYVRNSKFNAETDVSKLGPSPEKNTDDYSEWFVATGRMKDNAAVMRESILWAWFEHQGVDLHAVNAGGESLLHLVAQDIKRAHEFTDVSLRVTRFRYLMGRGLDPTLEDKEHRTPLDVAAALGNEDLLALFKQND